MTSPEWFRVRLGCVAVSAVAFASAVVVIGALTPGYNQWADAVSRLASPGERWALAARAAFAAYGLLVIAGASGATRVGRPVMTSDDEDASGSGDRPREPAVEEAFGGVGLVTSIRLLRTPHRVAEVRNGQS